MTYNRFVNSAFSELHEGNQSPLYEYQHLSILPLEEAIERIIPLIPGIVNYVADAKNKCNRNSTLLSWNESAAVYLYTMQTSLFLRLNRTLRTGHRHELKPWFAFLKLLITALEKVPSTKATVWRGVNYDDTLTFVDNDVHIWWNINSCSMDISIVQPFLGESGTLFVIDAIHGKDISPFSAIPDEKEVILMPGTRVRRKYETLSFIDRLFVLHLEEENRGSELPTKSSYLFERIKQEYQQHSRIERILNSSKTFPIEQSYINLAIVETKEQQEKEKKLLNAKLNEEIIGTYEEIYGTKTKIEIKEIFDTCKDQTKKVLILGRAGIGKTTFCRYVVHQWAKGDIWQQYQLVVLIQLRLLTTSRYPSGHNYSPVDFVKKEYFPYDTISDEDIQHFKKQYDKGQVLWILDGYDEIMQHIPGHLKDVLNHILRTQHHILTSRPYAIALSYDVKMEVIGFIGDNIKEFVKQFFDQTKDKIDSVQLQVEKLLSFLKCNPRIWGIVHIPVNLELICSLWCNTDWSETTTLTITAVYDKMIEWLCRRHLEKQNISSNRMTKEAVYAHFYTELAFLESLAFNGIENKSIILSPKLLKIAFKESKCHFQNQSNFLNIGILKSLDYKPIDTRIEADKEHYFLHLSFQEHFAARYLVKALDDTANQKKKAINFIKANKYNQRFELVFSFTSGLLIDFNDEPCTTLFWETLLQEPLDLIGLRHVQILIACFEEAGCCINIPRYRESLDSIIKWLNYSISVQYIYYHRPLLVSLRRSSSFVNQSEILDVFVKLYKGNDPIKRKNAYSFISELPISNLYLDLIQLNLTALNDENMEVRRCACEALGKMGEKGATNEVINRLIYLLSDTNENIRRSACEALGKMGEKAATNEVINRLISLLADKDYNTIQSACKALGKMCEKAATNEVINRLITLLSDTNENIRRSACKALGKMGEKAATNEVINRLINLLDDRNFYVRQDACETLAKMGEKAATNKVINRLISLLADKDYNTIRIACEVLGKMTEKAATNEVIDRLITLLGDENDNVRRGAHVALGKMGEKAATNEVIDRLITLLGDTDFYVSKDACETLGKMGEKAATNEVINRLINLLGDRNFYVRQNACEVLGKAGEKAATNEVMDRLICLLGDTNYIVKRSACETLGKMGEKAATNEVINRLIMRLDDTDYKFKQSACEVLGKVGEKAATNEVINRLSSLLGDTDDYVKQSACETLGKMGEKAATNEVINRLIVLLDDRNYIVKQSAYEALGKMIETAATNEVINRFISLLADKDYNTIQSACEVLGKVGEKAATNEVINRLSSLLGDTDDYVKRSACETLGKMGEKAATNEVINRLIVLLDDRNYIVKQSACKTLDKMGEKAATNEVINRLIILLDDKNSIVKKSAYETLGKMVETAATNEVINRLIMKLDDTDYYVRQSACEVLGKVGEKAVGNEVINRLVIRFDDSNYNVRRNACEALGKMRGKAATNEVINGLVILHGDVDDNVRRSARDAVVRMGENVGTNEVMRILLDAHEQSDRALMLQLTSTVQLILSGTPCLSDLKDDTVRKLWRCSNELQWMLLNDVFPEKFMRAFLETEIWWWLPIIRQVFPLIGYGITLTGIGVVLHGGEESIEMCCPNTDLCRQLQDYFINWPANLYMCE